MKLLFEDCNQYHHNRYYLCETDAEYDEELAKAKADAQASEFPNPWGEGTMVGRPCYEGEITCYPTTMVLDGFASRGGHEFRANGFTHCLQKDWHGGGYSITEYYIRPNGIVKNESADTKEWWVA